MQNNVSRFGGHPKLLAFQAYGFWLICSMCLPVPLHPLGWTSERNYVLLTTVPSISTSSTGAQCLLCVIEQWFEFFLVYSCDLYFQAVVAGAGQDITCSHFPFYKIGVSWCATRHKINLRPPLKYSFCIRLLFSWHLLYYSHQNNRFTIIEAFYSGV